MRIHFQIQLMNLILTANLWDWFLLNHGLWVRIEAVSQSHVASNWIISESASIDLFIF